MVYFRDLVQIISNIVLTGGNPPFYCSFASFENTAICILLFNYTTTTRVCVDQFYAGILGTYKVSKKP